MQRFVGLFPGRVTFVIGKSGVARMRFDSQLQARKYVSEALEVVKRVSEGSSTWPPVDGARSGNCSGRRHRLSAWGN